MSLDDLKKSIRSLLTSTPNALTLDNLNKDYREFFGVNIPYQKYGYNSLEQFLKSNPDVCVVNGTGKFATITPCISEKAAHINEMVMRQKKSVPKNKRAPRFQTRTNYTQNRVPVVKRTMYTYAISPCISSNSSMMSSTDNGRTQYNSQSKWTVQNFVPPQLMYSNIQSSFTNNNQAVYNNKPQVKSEPPVVSKPQPVISKKPLIPLNDNVTQPKVDEPKVKIDYAGNSEMSNTSKSVRENDTRKLSTDEQNVLKSRKKQLEALIKKQVECGNVSKSPEQPRSEKQMSSRSGSQTITRPKSQISNRPHSRIFPDDAPVLEEEDQHMFTSKTLELFKPYIKQQELSKGLSSYSSTNEPLPEKAEVHSNVPPAVQDRLKKLIAQYEDGIWCAELPDIYRKQFRRELRFLDYGYTSLIEMCISLKDVFHYVRPGKDDFKLYDCTKPLPETVTKNYTMASSGFKENTDDPITMEDGLPRKLCKEDFLFAPKDIFFEHGVEIPRQFLPAGTKVDSILDVVVVEAYDPSKFWIYLGTTEENCDLDVLMNDMQSFYENPKNKTEYVIPPALVSEGMYLAQVWFGEYHRAKVLEVFDEYKDLMRVYFIDYGTVARTPINGALFLPQKFAELPAQAIRCRLSNIVPVEKGVPWPKEASDFFRTQVNARDTKIKISHIDWDEEYVCVFLADVTDCKKITYLNDLMVKEGHAVWDGEEQKIPFVLPNYKTKVQNLHLFPTFLELECGMAPNVADMLHLEALQVPINFCIPQYFDWIDDEASAEEEELERHQEIFAETVRNNRRCLPWGIPVADEQPEFNFAIFGEMEEEMREFKEMIDNENYGYYDQANFQEEATQGNYEDIEIIHKANLEVEQFSESILKKLEGETDELIFDSKCEDFINSYGSEVIESELSMLLENDETESDSLFGDDRATVLSEDINIFDNPEYFEKNRLYEDSESPEAGVTADSFLRKIEQLSTPVTPHSESGSSNFLENPFLSKSQTDLSRTASEKSKSLESSLKSFINKQSQYKKEKRKSGYDSDSSNSSLESFVAMAINMRRKAKLMDSIKSPVISESAPSDSFPDDFRVPSRAGAKTKRDSDPLNLQFKSELRPDSTLTLSLTNPFRSFLTNDQEGIVESFKKLQICSPDSTETTLIPPRAKTVSESTNDSEYHNPPSIIKSQKPVEPLFEFKEPLQITKSQEEIKTSISLDIPVKNVASTASSVSSSRSSVPSTCSTPNASSTPFTPPNFVDPPRMPTPPYPVPFGPQNSGFAHQNSTYGPQNPVYGPGPYPSWADGSGIPPIPQYHQWSNGNAGTPPPMGAGANFGFNNQPSNLRPPPGFAPRGNPNMQNFNPNAPSFNPNAPIYNPNAPVFNPNAPNFYPNQQRYAPNFNQMPYMTPNMPVYNPYINHPSNYFNFAQQQQRFMASNAMQFQRNPTYMSQQRPVGSDFYERYNQEVLMERRPNNPSISSEENKTLSDEKNACESQTTS